MATPTYTPIATQTLGSAAASITFSSIPGTYTDLRLVLTCTMSALDTVVFQYNGITTTTYSCIELYGNGTTAGSNNITTATVIVIDAGSSIVSSSTIPELYTIDVFSYAGATNKASLHAASMDHNGSGGVISSV